MIVRLTTAGPRPPTLPATLECDWPLAQGDVLILDGERWMVTGRGFACAVDPQGMATACAEVWVERVE